ncbi:MAG: transglutaminase domain-containing protein [Planctomycetia bacterium]|jgi:sugar lactone lactonase YvrE
MIRRTILSILALSLVISLTGSAWAVSGDVVKEFPTPGKHPTGLTYDAKTKTLWLADRMTDKLYQINPETGKVIKTLDAPDFQIEGLAMANGKLWAMDVENSCAYLINPKTGVTERKIEIYCAEPTGLAFDGKYLWTASRKRERLYKINPADGTTERTYPIPAEEAQGLAFDGKYLWVSDRKRDEIYMLSPWDCRVIMTIKSPGPFPRGLAYDGKYIWNVDYQTDKLYKIVRFDKETRKIYDPKRRTLTCMHELHNAGPKPISADVYLAIPQNRQEQKLLGEVKIEPKPVEIMTNKLGQQVARCHFDNVKAGEKAIAKMTVDNELSRIMFYINPERTGTLADVPKDIKEKYLVDGAKFDINDSYIKSLTKKVVGNEKNCYWIARRIYNYVLDKVEYERVAGWNSASHVLRSGKGSCSEFSFSLIAMCRAAGLPARFVGSVVVRYDDASTDYGVFHRWAEVYLPNYGWVTFDPSSRIANSPIPANQAMAVGYRDHRYLITTYGATDTKGLEWNYTTNAAWKAKGPARVIEERVGEWEPLEAKK